MVASGAYVPLLRKKPSQEEGASTLVSELRREIEGEVRFGKGDRALYANDASSYRQVPIGVVIPRSIEDVVATVAACRRHGIPLFGRGTGTGLAGQSVNEAVLIDFTKYLDEILELDPERRFARVQPGIILDSLRDAAEEYDLTFGPDPATHTRCTLGGMIGNNSCGTHSILAGLTSDNIEALDVLLYDGTRLTVENRTSEEELERIIRQGGRRGDIYKKLKDLRDRYADLIRERFPRIPRRISGYNLDALLPEKGFNVAAALVGTESTCALTLEARCKLIPSPQHRSLLVLGYDAPWTAADHAAGILKSYDPIALETFDQRLVQNELKKGFKRHPELLPEGDAWLLVEFGADSKEEADEKAERLMDDVKGGDQIGLKLYEDPEEESQVWEIREGGVGHSKIPGEHPGWPSWEDAAVSPEDIGDYLRDFEKLVTDHGLCVAAYFGHVGHGCVHSRLNWDFSTAEGVRNYRRLMEDAADLVTSYGGSLSGEHGDGHARAELLPKMFGEELVGAFREFKAIWDPDGKMNPHKVSDPYPLDTNLRITPSYRTMPVETRFKFPDDDGSFAAAAERCFGVGICREVEGSTMCPSYMATREEKHSTRGRARLLFEMMHASQLKDGWRDESVKESLDLCLACKGCKHDCPVRVDMATYKAEFLSHYYEGRLRPAAAYALGLIYWHSRLASLAPGLANFFTQTPGISTALKRLGGLAPERPMPAFASETFRSWFQKRGSSSAKENKGRVILWPDTFNNYFQPEVARAAVEVLEDAGFRVELPRGSLCCGRPLYDYGMLTLAKRQLRQILERMRPEIEAGIPVIGLEPSCTATFRDELVNLFPHDQDAKRLSKQTFTFAEFLVREGYEPPELKGEAIVHGHCHHKALFGMECDNELLGKLGLDYKVLDSGCCGLAGSFGYESGDNYEVSIKCGERVLLPAVREAEREALIITDGFSCREQIEQTTNRQALHLAQVIELAMRDGKLSGDYPESGCFGERPSRPEPRSVALLGAALAGGALAWKLAKRRV